MSDSLCSVSPKRRRNELTNLAEQINEGSNYKRTLADLISKGIAPQTARIMAKAAAEHGNEPIIPRSGKLIR